MAETNFTAEEINFFKSYNEKKTAISMVSVALDNEEKRLSKLKNETIKKIELDFNQLKKDYDAKLAELKSRLSNVSESCSAGEKYIQNKKNELNSKINDFETFKSSYSEDEWLILMDKMVEFKNKK